MKGAGVGWAETSDGVPEGTEMIESFADNLKPRAPFATRDIRSSSSCWSSVAVTGHARGWSVLLG